MRFDAIIFDFDGVLLESEYAGNRQIAENISPASATRPAPEDSMANFMGLAGADFLGAIESAWIGRPVPDDVPRRARRQEDDRADRARRARRRRRRRSASYAQLPAVAASSHRVVEQRPAGSPRHLDHLGVREAFGEMIFSGREHVARGKPAPDLYLHAAGALGVDIGR
jgi:beta-phosphoglucomutase-like phosphatase (HAD superfamily)